MPECPVCKKQTVRYEKYELHPDGETRTFRGYCLNCQRWVMWTVPEGKGVEIAASIISTVEGSVKMKPGVFCTRLNRPLTDDEIAAEKCLEEPACSAAIVMESPVTE